jgi:hypothetical protein
MFKEMRNGHFCMSDINLVSALCTESWPIQPDGKVDCEDVLPPLEHGFTYVREFTVSRRKDFPGIQGPSAGFAYYSKDIPKQFATDEKKPVVMFAIRPLRGAFGLHERKVAMWHAGRLMVNGPQYAAKHRELLMQVRDYLARYRDLDGADVETPGTAGDLLVVRTDGTMANVGGGE